MVNVLHAGAVVAILLLLFAIWRDVRSRSPLLGHVLLAGLAVRGVAGTALFLLSYWNLPFLRSLHADDGFWLFAPDARVYYNNALDVLARGFAHAWDHGSPRYVALFAAWMRVVGANPFSGTILNLLIFGLLCAAIVRFFRPTGRWRDDLPCAIVLGGLGLLPSLVVHSTQSLTDDVVIAATFIALMSASTAYGSALGWSALGASIVAAVVSGSALLLLTDMRSYFALMIVACLLPAAMVRVWSGRKVLVATATTCVIFLSGSWSGYKMGEDPYWNPMVEYSRVPTVTPRVTEGRSLSQRFRARVVRTFQTAWVRLRDSRLGFIASGGATNIVSLSDLKQEAPGGWRDGVRAALVGYCVLFIPIDVLARLDFVRFSGGQGLLAVTDLDTLLMDGTIVGVGVLLWRRRTHLRANPGFAVCAVVLFALTATLLAYTVTNYGTLILLRAMVVVPVWMLALTFGRPPHPVFTVLPRESIPPRIDHAAVHPRLH
jgi:hypothetical protein